jgi:hypothetical protein
VVREYGFESMGSYVDPDVRMPRGIRRTTKRLSYLGRALVLGGMFGKGVLGMRDKRNKTASGQTMRFLRGYKVLKSRW